MQTTAQPKSAPILKNLLEYLEQDPRNRTLLADAATAAFESGDSDLADALIERSAALGQLPNTLLNLKALIAMVQRRFDLAVEIFAQLQAAGVGDPAMRFNFAWSKAMMRDYQGALELLDEQTEAASPEAPALKIRLLHHLARLDDALSAGEQLLQRTPENHVLAGLLASVAIDAEKPDLAARYAAQSGDNAEGQAAMGTLALRAQDTAKSLEHFDNALRKSPDNPRALIGKGLNLLTGGDIGNSVKLIDRGAELFNTHIGSWIAAGWAHFLAGNYEAARDRFQRALEIDPNFAETHGGIAVLDVIAGRKGDAERESQIALRLDKQCFGAVLARSLLLQQRGHSQMAQKTIAMALAAPIGPNGETLAQMVTTLSRGNPH